MLVSLISKEIEQNTNNEYALRTSGTGINHWNLTFVEPKKLSKNDLLLKEELHNTLVNNRHYVRPSQSKVISESTDGWQFTAKTRLNEWRQKKNWMMLLHVLCTKMKPKYPGLECFHLVLVTSYGCWGAAALSSFPYIPLSQSQTGLSCQSWFFNVFNSIT